MKKWHVFITLIALSIGFESTRADSPVICSQGYSTFGRLTCRSLSKAEPVLHAYFLGASSLDEVRKNYAERFEKIRQNCDRKVMARQPASIPKSAPSEGEVLQFNVQTVTSCIGKRGYQEPCVRNSDCIENFCHPDRGTCSAIFTVPLGAAQ